MFLKAKVLYQMGDEKGAATAFKEAAALRKGIAHASEKGDRDLREEDFDELVTFWSI